MKNFAVTVRRHDDANKNPQCEEGDGLGALKNTRISPRQMDGGLGIETMRFYRSAGDRESIKIRASGFARLAPRVNAHQPGPLTMFEELHSALVLLRRCTGSECPEVFPFSSLCVFFSRIKPVLAGGQFANHEFFDAIQSGDVCGNWKEGKFSA